MKDRETGKTRKRFIVFFENIDKALILNPTNKNILIDALGKAAADWLGATVGVFVDPNVTFGGKRTGGVRLKVLLPPARAAKPAKPVAAKPTTPAAAATEWSEEKGDPGADPSMADFEPAE